MIVVGMVVFEIAVKFLLEHDQGRGLVYAPLVRPVVSPRKSHCKQ